MKQRDYRRETEAALKQCPNEAAALASAKAEIDRLQAEKTKAQAALRALRSEGAQYTIEKRVIGGVEIAVQRRTDSEEYGLLNRHLDKLDHQIRHASHLIEGATRRLSIAVASRLGDAQSELMKRTEEALRVVTQLCADAEALEDSMRAAGLDHETVFAVRYPELQALRLDQNWTRGQSILETLKGAQGVAA